MTNTDPVLSRDYEFSRLCFEVQSSRGVADEYRRDREAVLARYKLSPDILGAIRANDVVALSKRTNPVLLRYFFFTGGMADSEFIGQLMAAEEVPHG